MNQEYYFGQWPIGTKFLSSCLNNGIFQVTGHVVSTWVGSERPWFGVATELVVGNPEPATSPEWYEKRLGQLVAGTMPEREKCHVMCINGSGSPGMHRLDTIKMLNNGHTTFFTWGSHGEWMVLAEDPGDPSVGMPGCAYVFGSMGSYPMVKYNGEYEEEVEGYEWLLDVAYYLLHYLMEHPTWSYVPVDGEEQYPARVTVPWGKEIHGRRFTAMRRMAVNQILKED